MKFKVIFDAGKPYEEIFNNAEDLKQGLKDFYSKYYDGYFRDVFISNESDEDISETPFICEMIEEILDEVIE